MCRLAGPAPPGRLRSPGRGRNPAPTAPTQRARACGRLGWPRPRRRSPPWHQGALPPHARRHGHRWRRSGVYVKDAASPGGRRRLSRRRRRPAEAALVNRGLGEPRMEVAVAAAAAGRALRRAGGKGGRGRGGPGPGRGRGASGATGWAVSRALGGRPDGSAGRGAAATSAGGRCEIRGAPGTGVGMVTPVARAWAAWGWHRQRGFPGTGVRRVTPTLVWWWPPRCEAGAALCAGRWWAQH